MVQICFNIEVVFGQLSACTSQTNLHTVDGIVTKYFVRYDTICDLGFEVTVLGVVILYGLAPLYETTCYHI